MEWLFTFFYQFPYLGVGIVFLLLGIGLPIPEEVVLVVAGFICHMLHADPKVTIEVMIFVCVVSILAGDLIPFTMGKLFGPRLLRLRFLRFVVSRQRLATFDRWFRRRGDLVIFFARFVPGLRTVAYFTAGTMRMRWLRFLSLDVAGILLVAPLFAVLGYASGDVIDTAIHRIKTWERGILLTVVVVGLITGSWYWFRRRRARQLMVEGPREAYVAPSVSQVDVAPTRPKGDSEPTAAGDSPDNTPEDDDHETVTS
ncbi:MAG: DedA family protein [Planctomycetota bacterium]|jgi:membrane protein DedA with SNARE-associated domain